MFAATYKGKPQASRYRVDFEAVLVPSQVHLTVSLGKLNLPWWGL